MTEAAKQSGLDITREQMIQLLNEDLEGEHQALIAYILYSQVLKGAAYANIARELESHAGEEPGHASVIAKQLDYLGGMRNGKPKPVLTSNEPVEMLRAVFETERETLWSYREQVRQAEVNADLLSFLKEEQLVGARSSAQRQ